MEYYFLFLLQIFLLFLFSRRLTRSFYTLSYKITKNKKIADWLFAVVFLPGTILHELSHFFSALFLLVPVGRIDLMPKRDGNNIRMGSVTVEKSGPVRRFIIAISPVIFGIGFIFATVNYFLRNQLFSDWRSLLFLLYLLFVIGNTMFSSKKDMEGTYKLFIFIALLYLLLRFLGVQVSLLPFLEKYTLIAQKANFYLAFPLLTDFILILIFRSTAKSKKMIRLKNE